MSCASELDSLHTLTARLRGDVASLRNRYGDTPPTRRIVNDAERLLNDLDRLDIDVDELDTDRAPQPYIGEKILVPDTPYDAGFWRDVDHEGIGGQLRSG